MMIKTKHFGGISEEGLWEIRDIRAIENYSAFDFPKFHGYFKVKTDSYSWGHYIGVSNIIRERYIEELKICYEDISNIDKDFRKNIWGKANNDFSLSNFVKDVEESRNKKLELTDDIEILGKALAKMFEEKEENDK